MSEVTPHLCIKKFDWSWRPRLFIHYDDGMRGEIYIGIFKSVNNNYLGINGCKETAEEV